MKIVFHKVDSHIKGIKRLGIYMLSNFIHVHLYIGFFEAVG